MKETGIMDFWQPRPIYAVHPYLHTKLEDQFHAYVHTAISVLVAHK